MGTITARRRKDGSTGYTARVRLKRDGKIVHSEVETFNTRALAKEWMTRREAALQVQKARGEPVGTRMTLGDMVEWYEGRERPGEPWGRTKKADLARLKAGILKDRRADTLTRQDFIAYVEKRRKGGAGPATAGNDLIWLRGVFKAATAVLGVPTPTHALDEAAEYLRGERTIAKPKRRDRRLTADEEKQILAHFARRDVRAEIPMLDLVRFALLTARRQDEIVRLQWADLDKDKGVALLRDVKHPTRRLGNDKTFRMLSPAWALIEEQPRVMVRGADGKESPDPRVFPFDAKSVGAAFTRAVRFLELGDLHFHDLRHEATSRLFEKGYSIQEVAQFTLHESWATLKRYTHLKPEDVPER
jgi:integrase